MQSLEIDFHPVAGAPVYLTENQSPEGQVIIVHDLLPSIDAGTIGLSSRPSFGVTGTLPVIGKILPGAEDHIRIGGASYLEIVNNSSYAVLTDLYRSPKPYPDGALVLGLTPLPNDELGQISAITRTATHDVPNILQGLLGSHSHVG